MPADLLVKWPETELPDVRLLLHGLFVSLRLRRCRARSCLALMLLLLLLLQL